MDFDQGFLYLPHFIEKPLVDRARDDLEQVFASGQAQRAGVGKDRLVNDEVRRDEIFWLDLARATPVQKELLLRVDQLRVQLREQLRLPLHAFEGHYARYPAGGFYRRHVDTLHGKSERLVSCVLYLNRDWRPGDGGELRIYHDDGFTDIPPIAGGLVYFRSDAIEHEVLPSHVPRLSFTGWFRSR